MAYTILPDADCEAIVDLWISGDLWLALNTGDPGKDGNNQSLGLARVLIEADGGWTAFEDYIESGGRLVTNVEPVLFPESSEPEMLTHASLWTAETGGTYRGGAELLNPVQVNAGETVTIPSGDIRMIGTGVGVVVEEEEPEE